MIRVALLDQQKGAPH